MAKINLPRDPAIIMTIVAAATRCLGAFQLNFDSVHQGWWNAAAAAVAGLVTAVWVKREGQVPALLGLFNALIALAVGYGLHWTAEQQAIVISLIGVVLAAYSRTQVVAPVPAPAPTVQVATSTDAVA